MTFFPAGFDPRDERVALLFLANVNVEAGDFGFIMGTDGVFTDTNGKKWYGSRLITSVPVDYALGGTAPSSQVQFSYFDDPDDLSDLSVALRDLDANEVKGRFLTLYVQPLGAIEEIYAPVHPPIERARRIMRGVSIELQGAHIRTITLTLESSFRVRVGARSLPYNTVGHSELVGAENPSLEFVPANSRVEGSIIG